MNPATRVLLTQLERESRQGSQSAAAYRKLEAFLTYWDRLERLVIRVFKGKSAQEVDEEEHQELRGWLLAHYPEWQADLGPYWQSTQIGGEAAHEDPFAFILDAPQAGGFVKNWQAMQALPSAREAINGYLLDLIEKAHRGE